MPFELVIPALRDIKFHNLTKSHCWNYFAIVEIFWTVCKENSTKAKKFQQRKKYFNKCRWKGPFTSVSWHLYEAKLAKILTMAKNFWQWRNNFDNDEIISTNADELVTLVTLVTKISFLGWSLQKRGYSFVKKFVFGLAPSKTWLFSFQSDFRATVSLHLCQKRNKNVEILWQFLIVFFVSKSRSITTKWPFYCLLKWCEMALSWPLCTALEYLSGWTSRAPSSEPTVRVAGILYVTEVPY